jgi:signal transduction histidine kinase
MPDAVTSPRTDALDVLVELLSDLDGEGAGGPSAFYDRICDGVCRLTSMERAGLFLYDDARKLVVPVGSHGVDPTLLRHAYGTLEETPIAQRALAEDRVVEATGGLERELPERYAGFAGVTTITCTPVAAGGRWLGVIFADRGGVEFTLAANESYAMWTLGKTAALAASARNATTQQGRARILSERLELAREIHQHVMQRLFGVSLVLGSDRELSAEERERCVEEIRAAVSELRSAVSRPPGPVGLGGPRATLAGELGRLDRHYRDLPLEVDWEEGVEVPERLEPLAQAVLAEALHNAHKHAEPTAVSVTVGRRDGTFALAIVNDGVAPRAPAPGAGMGLRLAAVEALGLGGVVEFGAPTPGSWRVRLVVPLQEDPE